jgi:hypothetical protein
MERIEVTGKDLLYDKYLDWLTAMTLIIICVFIPIWIIITTKEWPTFYNEMWEYTGIAGLINLLALALFNKKIGFLWLAVLPVAYFMGWIHLAVVLLSIFTWIWRKFGL